MVSRHRDRPGPAARWTRVMCASALLAVLPAGAYADEANAPLETPSASSDSPPPPVYVPPPRGTPRGKVAGGQRGGVQDGPGQALATLAPEHVGLTTEGAPTLWWYLAGAPVGRARLTFSLWAEDPEGPDLERELPAPQQPGFQALDLAALGIELEPGTEYQWLIALVPDHDERALDRVANGWIRRVARPAALTAGSTPGRYASAGIWYDAVAALMSEIASSPDDARLRRHREVLLDSGGVVLPPP